MNPRLVLLLASLAAAAMACDTDDGREMQPPDSDQTTTTSTTTTIAGVVPTVAATTSGAASTAAPGSTTATTRGTRPSVPDTFSLAMPWADGERIPERYTCDAQNQVGPIFNWFVPPDDVAEFAIVVDDPDAGGFVHWVATGIPPSSRTIDASQPPSAVVEAVHGAGETSWFGPCTPEGDGPHQYQFTLYALDRRLGIAPNSPAVDVIPAIQDASIATATYTGVYSR